MNKKDFLKKYPVTLPELLTSPCVFRETFLLNNKVPFPSIHHLRDICEYANYTYGALRTSLSRTIKANELDFFFDEGKIKRFRLTRTQLHVSKSLMVDIGDARDFSIVIFSFTTEQEEQRRIARYLLHGYGFRPFAQNTYIRRRIIRKHFEESLSDYGLMKNVFLLDCSDPGTEEFKERLYSKFEMDKMLKLTRAFYTDLNNFLTDDLEPAEYSRRLLYIGPVYYNICFVDEVPLPENYFPEDYPIKELKTYLQSIPDYRWKDFIDYYMKIETDSQQI